MNDEENHTIINSRIECIRLNFDTCRSIDQFADDNIDFYLAHPIAETNLVNSGKRIRAESRMP